MNAVESTQSRDVVAQGTSNSERNGNVFCHIFEVLSLLCFFGLKSNTSTVIALGPDCFNCFSIRLLLRRTLNTTFIPTATVIDKSFSRRQIIM